MPIDVQINVKSARMIEIKINKNETRETSSKCIRRLAANYRAAIAV